MRRREFIGGLGTVAAWAVAARAQQGDRVRRVGVLMPVDENDPAAKTMVSAFTQALADLGWTDGRNVRMDVHWGAGSVDRMRMFARPATRRNPRARNSSNRCIPAGDADGADCICAPLRPGRRWFRYQSATTTTSIYPLKWYSVTSSTGTGAKYFTTTEYVFNGDTLRSPPIWTPG